MSEAANLPTVPSASSIGVVMKGGSVKLPMRRAARATEEEEVWLSVTGEGREPPSG